MSMKSQKPIKKKKKINSSCLVVGQGGLASSSTTEVASSGGGSIALLLSKTTGVGLRAPHSLPPQEVGPKLLPLPPQVLDPEQQQCQPKKVALSPCQTQEEEALSTIGGDGSAYISWSGCAIGVCNMLFISTFVVEESCIVTNLQEN
jgi:hypothetical protein